MYELYYRLVSLSLLSWFWQKSKSDSSEKAYRLPLVLNCPRHILDHLRLVSLKFNCREAILESLQECWNLGKTLKQRLATGAHSCRLRKTGSAQHCYLRISDSPKFTIIVMQRNTCRKGQRTRPKIWFEFCRTLIFVERTNGKPWPYMGITETNSIT